jgi:hypothetical protein
MSSHGNPAGSRAVQGCLFGAVGLFVLLLVIMILLAYQRFREETGITGWIVAPEVANPVAPLPQETGTSSG